MTTNFNRSASLHLESTGFALKRINKGDLKVSLLMCSFIFLIGCVFLLGLN